MDLLSMLTGSIFGPRYQEMRSVIYDSREAGAGDAFVCIKGEKQDGHLFIRQAIQNGAMTIIGTEKEILRSASASYPEISFVHVDDSRLAMAQLSAAVCDYPAETLKTFGVTGTNGKTTVSNFIYQIMNALSYGTGLLGTAGIWDDHGKTDFRQTVPTTPESPDIHRVLQHFCQRNMKAAVIETTSIALELKRVETIPFDIAIHTNLTPEHLEFHGTMEAYKQAKMKLFGQAERAVINSDDPVMSGELIRHFQGEFVTYSLLGDADLQAEEIETTATGVSFTLTAYGEVYRVKAPVFGTYNVSNLLAAIAACSLAGFSVKEILMVIGKVQTPEGRFQLVQKDLPYQILLDYAHTPDALEQVLSAVHEMPYKRLILMITGVGLRDPGKRPLMAAMAEGKAEKIVVSVDQPGFADRQQVVDDVMSGFANPCAPGIHSRLHREEAIHYALDLACPGDLVLLTGIGFGGYQIIGDEKVPYSELEVIDQYFDTCKQPAGSCIS